MAADGKVPVAPRVGDILVESIGCGCHTFWKVLRRTPAQVRVRQLEDETVGKDSPGTYVGSWDIVPSEAFLKAHDGRIYEKTLKIHPDGTIGPTRRLYWWNLWDGKPKSEWSS